MTDIEKIIWGALGGLTVFVIGQILAKFFVEPLHELRKAIGEVRFNLSFYAPTIHTPIGRTMGRSTKAGEALLNNSSELIARLHVVPFYEVTRLLAFCVLPKRKAVEDAAVQLRGLSTEVYETNEKANEALDRIQRRVERIEKLLKLKTLPGVNTDTLARH